MSLSSSDLVLLKSIVIAFEVRLFFSSLSGSSFTILTYTSLGNGGAEHLRTEESALGLFDHLLIHALRRMVHHHGASLIINLCVHSCVPNQVDNPFLAFTLRQTQPGREIPEKSLVHCRLQCEA